MSRNTYSNPKIFIGDKEIPEYSSITFRKSGKNRLDVLTVKINDPEYQDSHLFNEKIRFFLNEGGAEATPMFTGYIRDISPSDTDITITAYDPRVFISGKEARPVAITDKKNFDGYTAVQFLSQVVSETVNATKTVLDLNLLGDTDPPVPMKGFRTKKGTAPYDIFVEVLEQAVNDADPEEPLDYFVDMEGDAIVVKKQKSLGSPRAYNMSYMDGIMSLTYDQRVPHTSCIATGPDGGWGEFIYGNSPMGSLGSSITARNIGENAELYDLARIDTMKNFKASKEISANISRAYDVGLGALIYLNVPEKNIRGNHRVTSKSIQVTNNNIRCTLGLGKVAPAIGDYLERKTLEMVI